MSGTSWEECHCVQDGSRYGCNSEGTVKHSICKEKDGKLKEGNLRPGAMISLDQYLSSVPAG